MSPAAGDLLVDQIAPRLRSLVPRVVRPVGAEDSEELIQDGIAMAAKMLQSVETAGKTVTAGNIAHYCILHLKSGRRSTTMSRVDAVAVGTQLDTRSCVLSFEEEVGYDPELDEPITLGELLSEEREDPAMTAARNVDWDEFLRSHDYRYALIVQGIVEGRNLSETSRLTGHGYWLLTQLRLKLADDIRAFMGNEAVDDSLRAPSWRANLAVDREKAACRADRRRQ